MRTGWQGLRPTVSNTAFVQPVLALLACAAGALGFWLLAFPAPWLTGSAVMATVLALSGAPPRMPARTLAAAMLVLGLTMGAATGPGSLGALARWPASILAILATIPVIVGTAQLLLMRVFGWTAKEAFLSAIPGALSYTLAIAAAENLDVRKIAIVQSVRMLSIVLIVPVTFQQTAGTHAASTLPGAVAVGDWLGLTILVLAGIVSSYGMTLMRAPAAPMLGGLLVSAIAHASGWVTEGIPVWATVPAIVLIGANVGARFAGSRLGDLGATLVPSLACVAATFLTSALAGALTALMLGLPVMQTWLAFAPGGADTIAVLTLTLKLDATFVTVHQLSRFLGIAAALPFLFRLLNPAETTGPASAQRTSAGRR